VRGEQGWLSGDVVHVRLSLIAELSGRCYSVGYSPCELARLHQTCVEGILEPGLLPVIERCWCEDPLRGIADLSSIT
jgi:hypothetical protein